jgi:hypothetical protein
MHWGSTLTFDLDQGKTADLVVPDEIARRIAAPLLANTPEDVKELCGGYPLYRVTAEYGETGELLGVFEFGNSGAGLCGTAPACPNAVMRAPWVPERLAPLGRLPQWVATYLKDSAVQGTPFRQVFMVTAARRQSAFREFTTL